MAEASHKVIPLITNTKKPSVRMMSGQDSNLRTGLITALTNPNITAITLNTTQPCPATRIPGTSQAATNSASAVMAQRRSSCIRFGADIRIHRGVSGAREAEVPLGGASRYFVRDGDVILNLFALLTPLEGDGSCRWTCCAAGHVRIERNKQVWSVDGWGVEVVGCWAEITWQHPSSGGRAPRRKGRTRKMIR